MQIGFVGLGKMGGNMVHRIERDSDHEVVAFDPNADAVKAAEDKGAVGASSLEELVEKLDAPRMVWLMVPSGNITESTIAKLSELLDGRLGDVAARNHQPDHARLVELGDQLLERRCADRALLLRGLDGVGVRVEGDDLVVRVALDAMDHVAAHLPEADESDLHV